MVMQQLPCTAAWHTEVVSAKSSHMRAPGTPAPLSGLPGGRTGWSLTKRTAARLKLPREHGNHQLNCPSTCGTLRGQLSMPERLRITAMRNKCRKHGADLSPPLSSRGKTRSLLFQVR